MTMDLKTDAILPMAEGGIETVGVRAPDAVSRGLGVEKFSNAELSGLRDEMKQAGLDSWQAAELLSSFLSQHGYGVSTTAARDVVTRIDVSGGSLGKIQMELEKLAFVM